MKKVFVILTLFTLLSLSYAPAASADHPGAEGHCPPPFELHHLHDSEMEHHRHIGSDVDRNEDGYICVKHIVNEKHPEKAKHLHIDNNLPL